MEKQKRSKGFKFLFPFLGIGSIIWFCIRVIPKPSRAAYPCMRVAAPMASTFVLWLLGLGTSLMFLKQARMHFSRYKYVTAAGLIIVGSIVGGVFFSMSHSHLYAAVKANAPIGDAKGVNPGRVVWVHDSDATKWDGSDGYWWESNHTIQPVVDQMLSRTLRVLSGKGDDTTAWNSLFCYYNSVNGKDVAGYVPGEKIAIKINLTMCNFFPDFCIVDSLTYSLYRKHNYMNTSPQVVLAMLRQLVNVVGVQQADISVGDPSAYYPNEYYDYCHAEFPDVHYVDHAGKFGRTKVEFSEIPMYWSCRPAGVKQDYIPKHFAEATYLINIANMKSHMGGGITLCAKNHYGSFIRLPTDSGYYDLHQSLAFLSPEMGSYRALVDIMGHKHLGGKTVLYLIDGLYAGNHNIDTVPHTWSVAPFNGGWTSSLFGSQDPVAIESVLFDLFQLDEDPFQYPKIAGAEDYLIESAQASNPPSGTFYDPNHAVSTDRLPSLGVLEHWNNVFDRKYSRNLSTGNGIELVFIDGATTSRTHNARNFVSGSSGFSMHVVPGSYQIELSIPKSSHLELKLFNSQGRILGTVLNRVMASGSFKVDLLPVAIRNRRTSSGRYFAALYCRENGKAKLVSTCAELLLGNNLE